MAGIRAAIGIAWIVFWVGWLLAAAGAKVAHEDADPVRALTA
jgi:hypothetical protein